MRALTQWCARTGTTLAMLAIVVALALLAVAFLTAALFLALINPLGAALAALVTGGALLAVAVLLALVVWLRTRRPQGASAPAGGPTDMRAAAGKLGEMLGEEAATWVGGHPGASLLTALVAGFAVGSSPRMRRRLLDLFR